MVLDPKGEPINDDTKSVVPVVSFRTRAADQTLPFLFRFLLSLVVLVGSFVYLFVAKPETIIVTALLGFNAAVITFWFVKTGDTIIKTHDGDGKGSDQK